MQVPKAANDAFCKYLAFLKSHKKTLDFDFDSGYYIHLRKIGRKIDIASSGYDATETRDSATEFMAVKLLTWAADGLI